MEALGLGLVLGGIGLCVAMKALTSDRLQKLRQRLAEATTEEQRRAGLRRQVEATLATLEQKEGHLLADKAALTEQLQELDTQRGELQGGTQEVQKEDEDSV